MADLKKQAEDLDRSGHRFRQFRSAGRRRRRTIERVAEGDRRAGERNGRAGNRSKAGRSRRRHRRRDRRRAGDCRAAARAAAAGQRRGFRHRRTGAAHADAQPGAEAGRGQRMSHEDIEATKAPLMDHLIELRSRLIKALHGVRRDVRALLRLRQGHLQRAGVALRVGGGAGEFQVHLHRAARIFHHPVQARHVRRRLPVVSDRGGADLHVRRARALSSTSARRSCLI